MKKKNLILGILLGLSLAFFVPEQAYAAPWCAKSYGYDVTGLESSYSQNTTDKIDFTIHNLFIGRSYQLLLEPGNWRSRVNIGSPQTAIGKSIYFSTSDSLAITEEKGKNKTLFLRWDDSGKTKTCKLATYDIDVDGNCLLTIEQAGFNNPACLDHESPITFKVSKATWGGSVYSGKVELGLYNFPTNLQLDGNGNASYVLDNSTSQIGLDGKSMTFKVKKAGIIGQPKMCSNTVAVIRKECTDEERKGISGDEFEICNQIPKSGPREKCLECFRQDGNGDGKPDGIWTAIGCIDTSSTEGIVRKLMSVGISVAGGIALLMILAAAFLFATSEGEPKRTSEAKEILTSAIVGLIFIIFSVTILQFIGVNILKIPGFGE